MRPVPTLLSLCLAAVAVGCGADPGSDTAGTTSRAVTLEALCPTIHADVDALVVSSPDSQRAFLEQVERSWDASSDEAREALLPLRDAAQALVAAGTGPDFYAARDGLHAAVVAVDDPCGKVGSPILHDGPH